MKNWTWQPANTIAITHAALIWIWLFAIEALAGAILRHHLETATYHHLALGIAGLVFFGMWCFGPARLAMDIQELIFYNVLVQAYGLYLFTHQMPSTLYKDLAQLIIFGYGLRVLWPLFYQGLGLLPAWPPIGPLGLLRWLFGATPPPNPSTAIVWSYTFIGGTMLAAFLVQESGVFAGVPFRPSLTILFVFIFGKRIIAKLTAREEEATAAITKQANLEAQAKIDQAALANQAIVTAKNAELKTKNTQLETLAAERAAMVADLTRRNERLRDASHDFKVPLLYLRTVLSQVERQGCSEDQAALLASGAAELIEIQLMIGDLIREASTSADGKDTPQVQPVADLLAYLRQRFAERARLAGVMLVLDGADLAVTAPRQPLLRLISNLANNALLYSEPGSMITIRFRRCGQQVAIRVYNTGPGLPDANSPDRAANFAQLVERISVVRAQQPTDMLQAAGHGLGLAIVQRLATGMGTRVTLQSQPDFITIFRFKLPLAD